MEGLNNFKIYKIIIIFDFFFCISRDETKYEKIIFLNFFSFFITFLGTKHCPII